MSRSYSDDTGSAVNNADAAVPRDPIPVSFARLLAMVEHRVSRQIETVLNQEGLRLDQWRVLILLSDGRDHSMSEIASYVMVQAPTLTKIVNRLVEGAFVHRRVDDADRRRVLMLASEHGVELYGRLAPRVARVESDITAELDADEATQLMRLLGRLATPAANTCGCR